MSVELVLFALVLFEFVLFELLLFELVLFELVLVLLVLFMLPIMLRLPPLAIKLANQDCRLKPAGIVDCPNSARTTASSCARLKPKRLARKAMI